MPLLRRPLLLLPLAVLLSLVYFSYLLRLRYYRIGSYSLLDIAPLSCPNISAGADSAALPLDSRPRNTYLLLPPADPPPDPSLLPLTTLPPECLAPWLLHGIPCPNPVPQSTFTVIYTWVNGSDPLQNAAALAHAQNSSAVSKGQIQGVVSGKWYRDHDELRYSLRSVLDSLGSHLSGLRLVTMDYPLSCSASGIPVLPGNASEVRAAQIPQWLDMAKRKVDGGWVDEKTGVEMRVVSHWELGLREEVFNSFAIEAGLGGMAGVKGAGENIIYMNDDYFLLHPLTPSTFHTPYYGTVFRMQTDLVVQGNEHGKADRSGEWAALEWSGWLLDQRFGARSRPYVIHVAKSMSLPLLSELSLLFSTSFSATRTHAFRAQDDAYTTFLFSHFVIERHREALLWSFIVARLGGEDGEWGEEQMEEAWTLMGGGDDEEWYEDLEVKKGGRRTLERLRVGNVLGEEPASTVYRFSSHDGYPYTSPQRASPSWPVYPLPGSNAPAQTCKLEFELCLGTDGEVSSRASDVFKRITFDLPQCGDCIVTALVSASGELGLSAFLPPPPTESEAKRPLPAGYVPHLPLTPTHSKTSFSLSSVLPLPPSQIDLHAFTLALLSRYAYVIADTPVRFVSLRSPVTAKTALKAVDKIDSTGRGLAMVCLNDDIISKEAEVGKVVREWMGGRWGRQAGWEKTEGWW